MEEQESSNTAGAGEDEVQKAKEAVGKARAMMEAEGRNGVKA